MVIVMLQAPRPLSQSDLERAVAESKRTKVTAKKPTIVSFRLDDCEVRFYFSIISKCLFVKCGPIDAKT